MTFAPMDSRSALPRPGAVVERATLDFKARPTDDRFEAAKDVAALANAQGGTIVVGAVARGELLETYLPLTETAASDAQRTYEEAVRDRCRPAPLISAASLEVDGGRVLAVNVWPFVGQPVGVALKPKDLVQQVEGVFVYPVRVGAHTRPILPEQMHMFVDARSRRVALALRDASGSRVKLVGRMLGGEWYGMGRVLSVDEPGNSVLLGLEFDNGTKRLSLPFDYIRAVWRDGALWKIGISGWVDEIVWNPDTEKDYTDDDVLLMEVAPPRQRDRYHEQKVRVVTFPRQPVTKSAIANFIDALTARVRGHARRG